MPLTLKMLQESPVGPSDQVEVDGQPTEDIVIVARIVDITHQNMRRVYEVTDNTSCQKVIFY